MGKVYLVGAGPGACDLISVRGKRLLQGCDVLIYDRLASEELLAYAKADCEKIYVGKSTGYHSISQEEINHILVEKAKTNNTVVRLKGGDPFVFGRGGEEAQALIENNIEFETVPGITSAIAVPEIAGIPVTFREVSQDIHIVTGHTAKNEITDYKALARTKGTIVFLMAVSTISTIAEKLIKYGMDEYMPVAVIENGTTENERILKTELKDIGTAIKMVRPPAVIVVGETAKYDLVSKSKRTTVAITGTEDFRKRLGRQLTDRGYNVKEVCRLKVKANNVDISTDKYDWLVFTSRNGVNVFFDHLKEKKKDIRSLKNKIAVIGEGTYKALSEKGIYADYMPNIYTSRALGKGLNEIAENESKLILRAEKGSDEIYEHIKNYNEVKLYSVEAEYITKCRENYIVFGSSLGVNTYLDKYEIADSTSIIAIGEVTRRALESRGYGNIYCCKKPTVDSIVERIEENEKIQKTESK